MTAEEVANLFVQNANLARARFEKQPPTQEERAFMDRFIEQSRQQMRTFERLGLIEAGLVAQCLASLAELAETLAVN